jgi:hypothetical protein
LTSPACERPSERTVASSAFRYVTVARAARLLPRWPRIYANATGTIHALGTVNPEAGEIELRYLGRVCGIGAP